MAGFVGEYAKLINLCRKLLRPVIWESIPGHHTNVGSFVIASLLDGSRRQDSVPKVKFSMSEISNLCWVRFKQSVSSGQICSD